MRSDVITRTCPHPAGRIRLLGRVAGVESCELVADGDEIVVGSALDGDLVLADPLLPPRAFRLRREKCHAGTESACRCVWTLEAFPGTRVYVNRSLARAEKLAYGDTIALGCHEFVFLRAGDAARNLRFNQNVGDICARLLAGCRIPAGYLNSTPTRQHWRRRRIASTWVGLAALLLLLLAVLSPQVERWEAVQPPLEVSVVEPLQVSPDAVRSLAEVKRETFTPTEPVVERADLAKPAPRAEELQATPVTEVTSPQPAAPSSLQAAVADPGRLAPVALAQAAPSDLTLDRTPDKLAGARAPGRETVAETVASAADTRLRDFEAALPAAPAVAAEVEARTEPGRPAADLGQLPTGDGWKLPSLAPATVRMAGLAVARQDTALAGGGPARRLSIEEAAQAQPQRAGLSAMRSLLRPAGTPAAALAAQQDLKASLTRPSTEALKENTARTIDSLAAYKPSPVRFENFDGIRVPVVRIAEQLSQLAVDPGANPISADGTVTPEEVAVSWKSGAFRRHAAGNPPPEADPPTYCYVGKSDVNGKPHLYISFVCKDPDVGKLIANRRSGNSQMVMDDSVEIFLDTNFDRRDYYQMVVNAKGEHWAAYMSGPLFDPPMPPPQSWNASPTIKTTINRDAGQWVCEILIPFDRLGGVPAKGSRWAVNFCRNYRGQVEDSQLQTWFAVYGDRRNFHRPSRFGQFEW